MKVLTALLVPKVLVTLNPKLSVEPGVATAPPTYSMLLVPLMAFWVKVLPIVRGTVLLTAVLYSDPSAGRAVNV